MKHIGLLILFLSLLHSSAHAASFLGYSIHIGEERICGNGTTFRGRTTMDAWKYLPGFSLEAETPGRIRPDNPGGKIATLKGALSIRVVIRGDCVGIVELDQLTLERSKKADSWTISDAEFKRIQPKVVADNYVVISIVRHEPTGHRSLKLMYKRPAKPKHLLDFWELLRTQPIAASSNLGDALSPMGAGTAVLREKVEVTINAAPWHDTGDRLKLPQLTLTRKNAVRPHWFLTEAEWTRIKPLIR